MYKLFKLLRGKTTRMKKEWDLGQQVRRDSVQEEEEVFALLKMAETVQKQIGEFKAYMTDPRVWWVREWPGQVVICMNQIYWTAEVHKTIRGGFHGVKEYHEKLMSQTSPSHSCWTLWS